MRKILLLFLLLIAHSLWARTDSAKAYQGFSGGMMVHIGYLFGQDATAQYDAQGMICSTQGATFGLGGTVRVHLFKHLRIGSEDFVSTMNSTPQIADNVYNQVVIFVLVGEECRQMFVGVTKKCGRSSVAR